MLFLELQQVQFVQLVQLMAAGRWWHLQLDFAHRQSDEEVEDFRKGRVVDEEPPEELETGQLATARLLLLISASWG